MSLKFWAVGVIDPVKIHLIWSPCKIDHYAKFCCCLLNCVGVFRMSQKLVTLMLHPLGMGACVADPLKTPPHMCYCAKFGRCRLRNMSIGIGLIVKFTMRTHVTHRLCVWINHVRVFTMTLNGRLPSSTTVVLLGRFSRAENCEIFLSSWNYYRPTAVSHQNFVTVCRVGKLVRSFRANSGFGKTKRRSACCVWWCAMKTDRPVVTIATH